jgi:hypothetical protein
VLGQVGEEALHLGGGFGVAEAALKELVGEAGLDAGWDGHVRHARRGRWGLGRNRQRGGAEQGRGEQAEPVTLLHGLRPPNPGATRLFYLASGAASARRCFYRRADAAPLA